MGGRGSCRSSSYATTGTFGIELAPHCRCSAVATERKAEQAAQIVDAAHGRHHPELQDRTDAGIVADASQRLRPDMGRQVLVALVSLVWFGSCMTMACTTVWRANTPFTAARAGPIGAPADVMRTQASSA